MSNLKKLLKQQETLAEQIKQAEQVEKNRNRVEKLTLKLLHKHPALFTCELATFEKAIDEAFTSVAQTVGSDAQ